MLRRRQKEQGEHASSHTERTPSYLLFGAAGLLARPVHGRVHVVAARLTQRLQQPRESHEQESARSERQSGRDGHN